MRALVALNGKIAHIEKLKSILSELSFDYIVGVDGGTHYLETLGYSPNVLIGDFDSTNLEAHKIKWPNVKVLKFNTEKDMTDAELAFSYIADKGFSEIIVIGAFGGRLDHLLGNIFLLERYPNIMLLGPFNRAKLLVGPTDREIVKRNGFLSLIPVSDIVEGVTLKGFKYPLDDVTLRRGSTWGISNEIVSECAHIFIRQGKVLAIIAEEEEEE